MTAELTAWQKVQLARNPDRPHTRDYISGMTSSFVELAGDRFYGNDPAMVAGLASFEGRTVVIVGHQKERDTNGQIAVNFGMAHPEGFQKALRLMQLAEKMRFPVICLIDTPGAHPGVEAEERNQAGAIARNLLGMSMLKTPIIAVVIGEGGSGGALGIALADRVLMLENSVYSIISPEGCAAILWKNQSDREKAAEALKLTAGDLLEFGLIDEMISEPAGGAHLDGRTTVERVKKAVSSNLAELRNLSLKELLALRRKKYREMGIYEENGKNENVDQEETDHRVA